VIFGAVNCGASFGLCLTPIPIDFVRIYTDAPPNKLFRFFPWPTTFALQNAADAVRADCGIHRSARWHSADGHRGRASEEAAWCRGTYFALLGIRPSIGRNILRSRWAPRRRAGRHRQAADSGKSALADGRTRLGRLISSRRFGLLHACRCPFLERSGPLGGGTGFLRWAAQWGHARRARDRFSSIVLGRLRNGSARPAGGGRAARNQPGACSRCGEPPIRTRRHRGP